jgi:hypothetical protein
MDSASFGWEQETGSLNIGIGRSICSVLLLFQPYGRGVLSVKYVLYFLLYL